ncbi:hypothetical protein ZWY2020_037808 [Hordeum vulgare]|nr:hypothetical protein ZWY2020_037808 [Hordeum vulgare]
MYPKNIGNLHIARLLSKWMVLTDVDDWKRHRKVIANSAEKIRLVGNQKQQLSEQQLLEMREEMCTEDQSSSYMFQMVSLIPPEMTSCCN